jgi:hypothetical protein
LEEDNLISPEEGWKSDPEFWDDYRYSRDDFKKKDKFDDQDCSISDQPKKSDRTVIEKLNKSRAVKDLGEKALENQNVQREYTRIKKPLEEGINPVDRSKESAAVASDKVLIKGKNGRYLVEVVGKQVNVLGICDRGNRKNIKTFEKLMNKLYNVKLQY